MADRYDLAKDEKSPEKQPEIKAPQGSLSVWPMESRLYFNYVNSQWRVAVRYHEDNENGEWKFASTTTHFNGGSRQNNVEFDTKTEAEKWCRDKGLTGEF